MAGLCRILVAATLVVHLTVGCCWHHAHGCEGKDRPTPPHSDATHDGQCSKSSIDHSQHGPQGCEGAKCSFVSSSRTVSDSFVQPVQASFVALLDDQPSLVGIGSEQYSPTSGRLLPPVRLHLANQVLLI
jgi:hypothetical protein